MRLVAVSIVKNEADIIEAFVRHTLAWVDRLLVFDHDSTDGTREILLALRHEGLPVSLFTDDALGNLQQARSNHLVRVAAGQLQADWILPLDADEILTGPGRDQLEQALAQCDRDRPASLPLLNYYATDRDDQSVANPVLRLRYCQLAPATTRKIMVPRSLAQDEAVQAGKGNHALWRGAEIVPDLSLPAEFHLAHLALRSREHQVLRVALAELQKTSRGEAAAGLDTHYRLGFQLLAENPELFFATTQQPAGSFREHAIVYRGTALCHSNHATGWSRVARAFLPYVEKLAVSHGQLLDQSAANPIADSAPVMRELIGSTIRRNVIGTAEAFAGFHLEEGMGGFEGPVAEAFLPRFRWAYAPQTRLIVERSKAGEAMLTVEMLTYSENQLLTVEVGGVARQHFQFSRINQKEHLEVPLVLSPGRTEIVLRYSQSLVTSHDARKLAVIFLSLRVDDVNHA